MKVGIIGAGTMGSGIAQAFAQSNGYEVLLCDINEEFAANGKNKIAKGLNGRVAKGKMEQAAADAILAKITTGTADNKFGVAAGDALGFYAEAAALPGLAVHGITVHDHGLVVVDVKAVVGAQFNAVAHHQIPCGLAGSAGVAFLVHHDAHQHAALPGIDQGLGYVRRLEGIGEDLDAGPGAGDGVQHQLPGRPFG